MTVSAVPEPTTYAMLGASALIGGSLAWRRRSRREIDV
jgi:CHASE2 domain-containing sensor protein